VLTVLIVGGVWLAILVLLMAILATSKRANEESVYALRLLQEGTGELLADVAATVHRALEAERVTVVLMDPGAPASGQVGGCFGAPGLVGRHVHVAATRGTGIVDAADAARLGLPAAAEGPGRWTFAHLPLTGEGRLVGAVTVASRSRAFSDSDLALIERVARNGARSFNRRLGR
jgi:GAF domain-containing protein